MGDDLVDHGLELCHTHNGLSLFPIHFGDDDACELCIEAETDEIVALLRDLFPDQRLHFIENGC